MNAFIQKQKKPKAKQKKTKKNPKKAPTKQREETKMKSINNWNL